MPRLSGAASRCRQGAQATRSLEGAEKVVQGERLPQVSELAPKLKLRYFWKK